jgi:hypothetical protein
MDREDWQCTKLQKFLPNNAAYLRLARECPYWAFAHDFFYLHGDNRHYTFRGSLRHLYSLQQCWARSRKNKARAAVEYTWEEFRDYAVKCGYRRLYLAWLKSGFRTSLKPTVRKLDRSLPYTLDNIKIGLKIKVDNARE